MVDYVIFGNGWIGNRLYSYLRDSGENTVLLKERIGKVNIEKEIKFLIKEYSPTKYVINCIGKTGRPNIDWCQNNKLETFFSNVTVPAFMAEVCEEMEIKMAHIGSGCIFEGGVEGDEYGGGNGYGEYDRPNFLGSWYSKTKIFSEEMLTFYNNVLTLRIRMPIDKYPSNRNLIDKLIGYEKVIDVKNSVSIIPDFLKIATELMNRKYRGIYNVVNSGAITHRRILELYKEIVDPNFEMPEFIEVGDLKELGLTKAGRSNCILSINKLKERGIEVRDVEEALKEVLYIYSRNRNLKGI